MERGRAFIATARERLDQLWGRAEAAMSRIKERLMGEVERPQAGAERSDIQTRRAALLGRNVKAAEAGPERGDIVARRAALLGRGVDPLQEQTPGVERERVALEGPDRDRQDAILGRGRDGTPQREKGRDRGR